MNVLVFILVAVASHTCVKAENGTRAGVHNLVHLGEVDGKTYFYDETDQYWLSAGKLCSDLGLQLVTIETAAQAAFLKSKYSADGFSGSYWVGARDTQLPRQFTWNGTETEATEIPGISWRLWNQGFRSCVFYNAYSAILFMYSCDYISDTLCQTIV